jgi:hypothetical protein
MGNVEFEEQPSMMMPIRPFESPSNSPANLERSSVIRWLIKRKIIKTHGQGVAIALAMCIIFLGISGYLFYQYSGIKLFIITHTQVNSKPVQLSPHAR